MNPARQFDTSLTKLIGRIPRTAQKPFHYLGLAFTPATWVVVVGFIGLYGIYSGRPSSPDFIVMLLIPLASILKLFIRRNRPPTIYAENMRVKSYSFPSSHAYSSALGGGFVASLLFSGGLSVVGAAMLALIGIIGISRVHLGAHYPSDVVGGWLLAAICLLVLM